MSKACEGIKLAPVRLTAATAPAISERHYIIPSKRNPTSEPQSTLNVEDLRSENLFPALGPMKPVSSGASWGQIRARLANPPITPIVPSVTKPTMDFKQMIEKRIMRDIEEAEKPDEDQMDPFKMTQAQCEQTGWYSISLKYTPECLDNITPGGIVEPPQSTVEEEWTSIIWPKENTYLDGRVIELNVPYKAPSSEQLIYTHYSPESLQRSRNQMLAFIGKKQLSK